jgi:hypothetical protein
MLYGIPSNLFYAPIIGATGARAPTRMTGTTAQVCTVPMVVGRRAVITNGSETSVCVRFGAANTIAAVVTDVEIGPLGFLPWDVEPNSIYVSTISKDGATAHNCWVWQTSA